MGLDLRALLQTPELGLTLLCGAPRLDDAVNWVVPTDLHDPRRYLAGGELVLTGMMWRTSAGDSEPFVRRLVDAGAVALGAGDPDLPGVPDDLVAACERHQLPLFHVSADVSFATITEHVVRRLSAGRSADLAAVLARHRSLVEAGGDFARVLELVADELGLACGVLSPTGRLVVGSTSADRQQRQTIVAELARGAPQPFLLDQRGKPPHSVFGVRAVPGVGRLLVVDDDHTHWPPQRRAVVDELAAMAASAFERRVRETEAGVDLLTVIDDVADDAVVAGRLRTAGLAPDAPLAAVVLSCTGGADESAGVLLEVVEQAEASFAWTRCADGLVAIVAPTGAEQDLTVSARAVTDVVGGLLGTRHRLAIGVSEPVSAATGLVGALAEARHAHSVAAAQPATSAVAGAEQLSSHELLLASVPADVRGAFRARVLGPLTEYDEHHTSDLLHTLEVFVACSGSWSRAAAQLHVHVNTLRYRIERVEQLTGRDLRQLPDLVDLHLALQLR